MQIARCAVVQAALAGASSAVPPRATSRSWHCSPQTASRKVRCNAGSGTPPPIAAAGGPPPAAGAGPRNYMVALVTGGNTGIGFQTAKALLEQDYYVVLGCRNKDKAEAAKAQLRQLVPAARGIELATFDLADLASVRQWAQRAQDFGLSVDLLVNNAGVMAIPNRQLTKDGFEYQLGVNHLGHFLLTNMLLPLLSDPERPSRIVNVSSSAHYFGHMAFEDLQSQNSYNAWKAYGQSKLANVLFTYELERRLAPDANCTVNTLHPGVVNTELARYMLPEQPSWWQQPLMEVSKVFSLTPEQGAQTSIYLASSPEAQGVSGKYYDKCRPVTSSKESYDATVARKLWDASAELVNL